MVAKLKGEVRLGNSGRCRLRELLLQSLGAVQMGFRKGGRN